MRSQASQDRSKVQYAHHDARELLQLTLAAGPATVADCRHADVESSASAAQRQARVDVIANDRKPVPREVRSDRQDRLMPPKRGLSSRQHRATNECSEQSDRRPMTLGSRPAMTTAECLTRFDPIGEVVACGTAPTVPDMSVSTGFSRRRHRTNHHASPSRSSRRCPATTPDPGPGHRAVTRAEPLEDGRGRLSALALARRPDAGRTRVRLRRWPERVARLPRSPTSPSAWVTATR